MQSFSGKSFPQREFEIEALRRVMVEVGCLSFLEIGSRYGDSFHFLAGSLPPGSKALAVDLPGSVWGNPGSDEFLRRSVAAVGKRGVQADVIFGDSTDAQIIVEVEQRGPWDVVFIDGDHTEAGVRSDWKEYGRKAKRICAFHDIVADQRAGRKAPRFGVGGLWRELRETHRFMEFVDKDSPMGIGAVFL